VLPAPTVPAPARALVAAPAGGELPTPEVRRDEPLVATPASAVMEVATTPSGAMLVLDGKTLAQRSPARLEVAPGVQHTLVVRTSGRPGVAQRFMLDAGEEAGMEIDLRRSARTAVRRSGADSGHSQRSAGATTPASAPAPAATPPVRRDGEGTLVIASSPWCNVTVDGQARGTTPLNIKLKAGAHEIILSNPEFKIRRALAVDIEPNQTLKKSLDFAPE
jgi:hypothetical protein